MLLFVERAGAEVVECACVIEIPDLKVCTSYTPGHLCFSKYKIEMWAAFLRSITLSIFDFEEASCMPVYLFLVFASQLHFSLVLVIRIVGIFMQLVRMLYGFLTTMVAKPVEIGITT